MRSEILPTTRPLALQASLNANVDLTMSLVWIWVDAGRRPPDFEGPSIILAINLAKSDRRTQAQPLSLQTASVTCEVSWRMPVAGPHKQNGMSRGLKALLKFSRTLLFVRRSWSRALNVFLYLTPQSGSNTPIIFADDSALTAGSKTNQQ